MLTVSTDRKVANSVTKSGNVRIANAFGLPAGKDYSCSGATAYCEKICYAGKLEKIYKGFAKNMLANYNALQNKSTEEMTDMLRVILNDFVAKSTKWDSPLIFRIHHDGDFFSVEYTQAWINIISEFDNVQFWAYTRVVKSAVMLHKASLDNLGLYFSGDPDNIALAGMLNKTYGIRVAFVDETFAEGKAKLAEIGISAVKCPENNKSLPLISDKGSACSVCGLCIYERNNVLFSRKKK